MGGNRIAQKTIQYLPNNINTKMLERDKEKCYFLAERLNNTLIINADGRNVDALRSEGIQEIDAFVATTANSEAKYSGLSGSKTTWVKAVAEVENVITSNWPKIWT